MDHGFPFDECNCLADLKGPGVNGLGVFVPWLDREKGGSISMHTQHGVTELLIMVEGQITVGFMITFALFTKTEIRRCYVFPARTTDSELG
ncbi:hypothetical protein VNO80_26699 [Phaseolus coccineus]|uniref:Cupin type-1 domain-containing protein n=1 Tax=Phaseolus coccineus TaxID=3886 RepID=A0AAN9LFB7_PHACN